MLADAEDFAAARARLELSHELGRVVQPKRAPRVQRGRIDVSNRAPRGPDRVPRGSKQPLEVQHAIRSELERGDALNAIARRHGVTRDVVKVIRDGHSRYSARSRKVTA